MCQIRRAEGYLQHGYRPSPPVAHTLHLHDPCSVFGDLVADFFVIQRGDRHPSFLASIKDALSVVLVLSFLLMLVSIGLLVLTLIHDLCCTCGSSAGPAPPQMSHAGDAPPGASTAVSPQPPANAAGAQERGGTTEQEGGDATERQGGGATERDGGGTERVYLPLMRRLSVKKKGEVPQEVRI